MTEYTISVYMGQYKEKMEVTAVNQNHLRQKVEALGYRLGAIHTQRAV